MKFIFCLALTCFFCCSVRSQSPTPAGDLNSCFYLSPMVDVTVAAGDTAKLKISGLCAGGVFKWQVCTSGVGTYVDIPGADSTFYNFVATAANNGNKYRMTNHNPFPGAIVWEGPPATVGVVNSLGTCRNGTTSFKVGFSGTSYQWQVNSGAGFVNLTNDTIYAGVTTDSLRITNPPGSYYGNVYRCTVNVPGITNSAPYTLLFENKWTGAVNSDWSNPGNWACNAVPEASTDVIVAGSINPHLNSNTSIRSLKLLPPAIIVVGTGTTLNILH